MKERVRKCGGGREKADDGESKKLNSEHNGEKERNRKRERGSGREVDDGSGWKHSRSSLSELGRCFLCCI